MLKLGLAEIYKSYISLKLRVESKKLFKEEQIMSEFVAEVTDSKWETEVLGSEQPVLVDFWAAWCGPCRMLAPTVEAVAQKYQGKAKVVKLNVDENVESPAKYGIRGIPTLILFKNGQEVDRHVGIPSNPATSIAQMIERQLA
jgi:thioredoxin 1